jgi:hypothetical protein
LVSEDRGTGREWKGERHRKDTHIDGGETEKGQGDKPKR